ncbi:c-type cytochrome [Aliiroseovarius sp. KMU-50]|uniref:C-type cytochrome n=1 Tax=Aliiroseovarius salicola TaxID=3009082 RepID=A0ABT4VWF9_9RHOB|nr:c-type cytochrome [Aliiroseovarius sp. KMU-50]MDA5092578.1 c-type cytochrome [Aliiroseovarius sp. KMU-50]
MFDTMTLTKAGGAICSALLIFLLGNWVASSLYASGGGHGDEDHASTGYVIAVADDSHAEDEAEEAVPFADLLAAADVAKGEKAWSKCKACHKLEDGANSSGPHLFGLVNRPIASVGGFNYSEALLGHGSDTWTPEKLNEWLASPKAFAPGTKMSLSVKKEGDRVNLIAYLQSIGG